MTAEYAPRGRNQTRNGTGKPPTSTALPIQARGIQPQILERIEGAGLRIEEMDDDVAVVLHHPFAGFIALDAEALLSLGSQRRIDLFGDGMNLSSAGRRGDDEEVVERCDSPHVEDEDVACLVVGSHRSAPESPLQSRRAQGRLTSQCCDLQRTSFPE